MKNIYRLLAIITALVMLLSLTACGGDASSASAEPEALAASFTVNGAAVGSAISLQAGEAAVLGVDCNLEGYEIRFPDNALVEADFVWDTASPSKLDHIELTGLDAGTDKLEIIVEAQGREPVTYTFDVTVAPAPVSAPESSSSEAVTDSASSVTDSAPAESSSSSLPESSSSESSSSVPESSSSESSSSESSEPEEESSEPEQAPEPAAPAAPAVTAATWNMPDGYEYLDVGGYPSVASELIDYINNIRSDHGLSALVHEPVLDYSAQVRAEELRSSSDSEYSSHTRPDGSKWNTVFTELGITFYSSRGENLGRINFNGNAENWQLLVDGWENSATHFKNIVNSNFNRIGVGIYQNNSGKYFICTHFAN